MGIFKKKKEVKKKQISPQSKQPNLPELPKLPDFPRLEDEMDTPEPTHRLPSFPSNSLGTKFSQDTIKEAVSGEKEEGFDADEFAEFDEDYMRRMQEPLKKPRTREMDIDMPRTSMRMRRSEEPVFIRIDKFEDALEIFNETRKKISEIEENLEDIKRTREKEDKELQAWENEIKSIKTKIEKVDSDIFSKIR